MTSLISYGIIIQSKLVTLFGRVSDEAIPLQPSRLIVEEFKEGPSLSFLMCHFQSRLCGIMAVF